MNFFPYVSAIVLSRWFEVLLSAAFILNLMQFSMQFSMYPSLEMIPCLIVLPFSDFVFHKSQ